MVTAALAGVGAVTGALAAGAGVVAAGGGVAAFGATVPGAGGVGASCADAPIVYIRSAAAAAETPIPQVVVLFTAVVSSG